MKFDITRTSDFYGEHVLPESSRFYGRLHTSTADGRFFRNTVCLDTLGELLELAREQGKVVVSFSRNHDPGLEDADIEIYDTFRE